MTLSAGTRLGPYEILAPVGAGGMGEVYRAKDTRLDRTVAVKVLPEHLSASPESAQRFEREAKTHLAALPPAHLRAVRRRQPGRHRVPGDGVSRGRDAVEPAVKGAAPVRPGAAVRRGDRRRARQGAPAGDRAPGPEARQRDDHEVGREAPGLRPREGRRAGGRARPARR